MVDAIRLADTLFFSRYNNDTESIPAERHTNMSNIGQRWTKSKSRVCSKNTHDITKTHHFPVEMQQTLYILRVRVSLLFEPWFAYKVYKNYKHECPRRYTEYNEKYRIDYCVCVCMDVGVKR